MSTMRKMKKFARRGGVCGRRYLALLLAMLPFGVCALTLPAEPKLVPGPDIDKPHNVDPVTGLWDLYTGYDQTCGQATIANLLGSAGLLGNPVGYYYELVSQPPGNVGLSPGAVAAMVNSYLLQNDLPWETSVINGPRLDYLCAELMRGQRVALYLVSGLVAHFVTFSGWNS
jgi:hypothetical protein